MNIDNYNYYRDARTQGKANPPILYMDDGSEVELPVKWEVCPVCNGKGSHVNPSIDAGGLSAEAFCDDPEFAESYMAGMYDQQCNRCDGRTTVPGVNWDALTSEQSAQYEAQLRDEADARAEQLAELAMGC